MKNLRFIFRMFARNPLLVFVNLPGLAVGLSAVLLLSVYLKHELSYDEHFSTKDNVLRLYNSVKENGQLANYGICLRTSYTDIPQNIPEIEAATQLFRGWENTAEYQKKKYPALELLYADKEFFDIFGLGLIHGNIEDALQGDKKIVLNASTAQKIFNRTDCVGEVVSVSEEPFVVTGVIEDLPKNTHFQFDMLASMQTLRPQEFGGLEFFTYFRVNERAELETVGAKIADANNKVMEPWAKQFDLEVQSGTEELSRLHLYTAVDFDLSPKANLTHILIVGGIAFLILLIAMVNFINLYILHSEKRIAEIGARKTLGATQTSLSKLFYTETGIIGLLAFLIAMVITQIAQPYFADLMQRSLGFSEIFSVSGILMIVIILAIIVLVSGAYPTYYLSKLDLVNALKGKSSKVNRKSRLSQIAVVSQFTITVFLISTLMVVYAQVDFLKDVPFGFKAQNVIGVSNLTSELRKSYASIQDELSQLSFVESVGTSTHSMGQGSSGQGIKKYGSTENFLGINEYRVNPGFCKTMQFEIMEGRYFNTSESDKKSVILNETAVKLLGFENPVGKLVDMHGEPLKVIAMVKDFYYTDHPGEPIAPLVMANYSNTVNTFYLRTNGSVTSAQQKQIETIFKSYSPDYIFGHFQLTDVYANKYTNEERVMKLVSSGAVLAILISFVGLMALSILNVNRRKKEIGIRKVMGSTETQIVKSLLTETFVLIGIATGIAFAFSYMAMQQWLSTFANRIALSPLYFLLSALSALLIAFLAVGWQSWRAATRNPIEALKYE